MKNRTCVSMPAVDNVQEANLKTGQVKITQIKEHYCS